MTTLARRGLEIVFDVDSTAAHWSRHRDPASNAMRAVAPIAFWAPIAAVAAEPLIWADEAQDGHTLNARYARSATLGLAFGFAVSLTTKHFVHRLRPCTGAEPDGKRPTSDSSGASSCPRYVASGGSFFSEHTMALFAIAAATSFQARREQAPNATRLTAITFATATLFGIGRVYQHHHWLSDVVVGAAVGTATGLVAAQLTRRPM